MRRDALIPTLGSSDAGFSFVGGLDVAYEVNATDYSFGFWQYLDPNSPTNGCPSLPMATLMLTDNQLRNWGYGALGASDDSLRPFAAYYYQSATQLGGPAFLEQPFGNLIRYPGLSSRRFIDPKIVVPAFDPAPLNAVKQWLATQAESMIFVYGELDPWSATQFQLGASTDTFKATAPGNNHGSQIANLSVSDAKTAMAKLQNWLGVKPNGVMLLPPPSVEPLRFNGPPLP